MHRLTGLVVLALLAAGPGTAIPALAQGTPAAPAPALRAISPEEFVRLAYSSATLQARAAQLAGSRETRPEVKAYVPTAIDFRTHHLQRLEAFARQRNVSLPVEREFEHQVILENLEPLDYLALSRRYAEVQVQALQQEIRIYQAGSQSNDGDLKAFAAQTLPELQQQLTGAQKLFEAVRP